MSFGPKRLLIIGGSTRAAAWSAVRAGFQPICADLFADLDTYQLAQVVPVRDYPHSLPEDIAHVRADAWMFTGALENHPKLLEQIGNQQAHYGPRLGCSPTSIRLVRDPFWIAGTLRAAGLPALNVQRQSEPPPIDGSWLQKPISGGGGRLIRVWDAESKAKPLGESCYFQKFSAGQSLSGVFWRDQDQFLFLGATQQLMNLEMSCAEDAFAYCGSVGPVDLPANQVGTLIGMARTLADASDLQGLFGVDFLQDEDSLWLVELNPRYPASVEVLERATGGSIISLYHNWFSGQVAEVTAPISAPTIPRADSADVKARIPTLSNSRIVSKVVIYTRERLNVPDSSEILDVARFESLMELADVPHPGTIIEKGWPICTVISRGSSISQTMDRAQSQVNRLRDWLRNSGGDTVVLDRCDAPR